MSHMEVLNSTVLRRDENNVKGGTQDFSEYNFSEAERCIDYPNYITYYKQH